MIWGSKIGPEYDNASFSILATGHVGAIEACKRVASKQSQGVVLIGPVGAGKTHLLVCTARAFEEYGWDASLSPAEESSESVKVDLKAMIDEFADIDPATLPAPSLTKEEIENPVHVLFWYVPELLDRLREEPMEGIRWTENKCRDCDLLVLDDLGVERATDYGLERLEMIVDYRYRNKLPMAVSTNLKPRELQERYGERPLSRWSQYCDVAEMSGNDMRLHSGGA